MGVGDVAVGVGVEDGGREFGTGVVAEGVAVAGDNAPEDVVRVCLGGNDRAVEQVGHARDKVAAVRVEGDGGRVVAVDGAGELAERIETRYFITTLTDVKRFADAVRGHWSIENQLHWRLDVTFGEDGARTRKDNAPLNWNVMRKTALPLLRDASIGRKTSIKRKMFMAALDVDILERILFEKREK